MADILYQDDFQSGTYLDWVTGGDGTDSINLYQGNYSIRHDGLRTLTYQTSTQSFQNVALSMDIAASGLVAGDSCSAEVSLDGGANWQSLGSIGAQQADGGLNTFTRNTGLDNVAELALRFRAYTLYGHYCYADNVTLSGDATAQGSLFEEDFQDGEYSNWQLSGDGTDTANLYQSNYSLRIDGLRQATYSTSTQNYQNVSLSADMGALYLVSGDSCHAEYSIDDGSTWQSLITLNNGQDDGSFRSNTISSGLDNLPTLHLRFRAYTLYDNYCYGDNVVLSGDPASVSGPAVTITGNTEFGQVTVGESATSTITVTNAGDETLAINSLTGVSTPFAVSADNCSSQMLPASASCTTSVTFTPATEGTQNTTLTISSNAASSPDNVTFSGTGASTQGCDYDCFSGSGNTNREALTYTTLTGSTATSLVDYAHYGVPEQAANPTHTLEGAITFTVTPGTLNEQGTNLASAYTNPNSLPPFEFEFVQYGTHVIPTQRQVVNTGHTAWEWVLSPGRVWNESSDNGYSRVALPFALQEINANCTHNGVMTFLFKDDGSISDVAYQVAQETCNYFKFNLHGKVDASYSPATVANRQTVINDYVTEVANRLPAKSLAALATDYPAAGITVSAIGSDQSAAHLTAFGVLYNGTHYRGACQTRYGNYPFCDVMALPSYSTAKTIVAGLGTMRAEQLYGGRQAELKVSDWIGACSGSQWQDVSLLNALDMATGNYDSAVDSVDEGSQKTVDDFFLVASHNDKINHSCAYSRKTAPGTQFVYHTSDTYIVSRILQQYHEQQAGSSADFFTDLLVEDIFQPLHLSPLSYASKRTYDSQKQVWGGYGLTLSSDDFAKLGQFIGQSNGVLNGQTVIDPALLADALQQTANSGLLTAPASRYQHSVWAYDLSASTQLNCTTPSWVPYLSGFGGIGVVMLPNDMVYYYVSDNKEYGFTTTVKELNKISPVCGQ
ncbi:choice-of-anchor D domain-containing protein [Alteromonas ponticola]|uniref:Choice-of-anchor D domain-containing protein n=1 Tax=Alteromonas ponticola TaxID=2720613 RepID=A0ABX1R3B1_9ALTE|nr:choice-of-anchor D domain-containing protein [Alteromonas ponticola]NMH60263.1 choice-of-anchor D domain-containing protein [Alteromonas ponticola]